ncbi:MAG: SMP-30/gluconolactonase/LRE family protein [Sphingomonadales bacterium]|nr:MAG: SMP-30/gluconolactonase/LRE family protein [Sphingomonadales bacterium]
MRSRPRVPSRCSPVFMPPPSPARCRSAPRSIPTRRSRRCSSRSRRSSRPRRTRPPEVTMGGRIVVEAGDYMGETPVWSPKEQALYWVNCEREPSLRRWNPADGEVKTWPMPERCGGVAMRETGDPIVILASGVFDFDLSSGTLTPYAPSPYAPHVQLHESFIDRKGRLWLGSVDGKVGEDGDIWPGGGGFARLDGRQLTVMIPHMSITNMLAFSPNGDTMYFCDSLRRTIWAADMDPEKGAILGMRHFVQLSPEVCGDGACVDTEGGYWVAIFGGGEIRRYLPDGTLDHVEKLPFSQPTKPCFGGPDLKTIYVTSTQTEVPGFDRWGPNGVVYAFEPGITGIAEEYFAG